MQGRIKNQNTIDTLILLILTKQISHNSVYLKLVALYEVLVIFFLKYWLVIDMANGYLMRINFYFPGGISLGEISRIIFLFVLLFAIKIKRNSVDMAFIVLPFIFLSITLFQSVFSFEYTVSSINTSIKLCLSFLIFLFIKENLSKRRKLIEDIVKINSFILIANLLLSLFGIGFFTYESAGGLRFGGKGFFFAGNEVAAVILITYAILIYIYKRKAKAIIFITLIYLLVSFVSLTRASILGISLVFIASITLYHKKYLIRILSISLLAIGTIVYILRDYIMLAVNRAYFIIDNTSMVVFMLGGQKRWNATNYFYNKFTQEPHLFLTGIGWRGYAEQDLIDLIASFGIIGVSVYLMWFYFASYTYKNHNGKSDKRYIVFVFTLIFGIATLAGHVVSSAMLAPFVAILGNLHLIKDKKYIN